MTPLTTVSSTTDRVASLLAREYGLRPSSVVLAGSGVEADVWRIDLDGAHPLCFKWFRGPVDQTTVSRTLLMDRLARRGMPFPRLHCTGSHDPSASLDGRAVVVVDWLVGSMRDELCVESATAAAVALAEVHQALRSEPPTGSYGRHALPTWQTCGVAEATDRCDALREHIGRLNVQSELDLKIDVALGERKEDLRRADELRRALPDAPLEPLHFDYTRPNLLFQGTALAGVLDLKGVAGYAVWELGKLAFEPQTMVSRQDWFEVAAAAIAAYQARRPLAGVVTAARMTALYNLFSFWGVSARFGGKRPLPTGYEEYWLNRHAATRTLLASLTRIEELIAFC